MGPHILAYIIIVRGFVAATIDINRGWGKGSKIGIRIIQIVGPNDCKIWEGLPS